jgi:TRAP transporter TAXI family solute receptor
MTKTSLLTLVIALGLALAAPASAASKHITIATGGGGEAYSTIGAGLVDIINKKLSGYNASAQVTPAANVNCVNVNEAKADLGLAPGDTLAQAIKGDGLGGFKAPQANLRVLANTYPDTMQIVARKDSGITHLSDLRDKKVSVGVSGSGSERNAQRLFEAAGLAYKDFARADYLSLAESTHQMKKRAIDAMVVISGLPNPGILDITTSLDIVVVPMEAQVVRKLQKKHAFFSATVIPERTYQGQTAGVPSVAIPNLLIASRVMDEETAYEITKALFEDLDRLAGAHVAAKDIRLDRAAQGAPAPLHSGAEKYYREKGIIK